jgi:hypothetical protein
MIATIQAFFEGIDTHRWEVVGTTLAPVIIQDATLVGRDKRSISKEDLLHTIQEAGGKFQLTCHHSGHFKVISEDQVQFDSLALHYHPLPSAYPFVVLKRAFLCRFEGGQICGIQVLSQEVIGNANLFSLVAEAGPRHAFVPNPHGASITAFFHALGNYSFTLLDTDQEDLAVAPYTSPAQSFGIYVFQFLDGAISKVEHFSA